MTNLIGINGYYSGWDSTSAPLDSDSFRGLGHFGLLHPLLLWYCWQRAYKKLEQRAENRFEMVEIQRIQLRQPY